MKKLVLAVALSAALVTNGQAASAGPLRVNGAPVDASGSYVHQNTTYVPLRTITEALRPDAEVDWVKDRAVVRAEGLKLTARPGDAYIEANGRTLYAKDGVHLKAGRTLVPVRVLAEALGAGVEWDGTQSTIQITSGSGPILSGEQAYQADVVYWLSRIIYAESGNQPLDGKIAVGNVVLNRVASPRFPNSVYEVIFQRNQFTPAANGSINRTPSAESVVAAKLCLDGANTAGSALYFVNPTVAPGSWASRNRPYVATIGAHAFYG